MSQLKYWIWLASLSGVGTAAATALLRHFGTPENVFSAPPADYKSVEGLKMSDISALRNKSLDLAFKTLASCSEIGCRILTRQDAEYPDRLRNIFDPPVVLYVLGKLPAIDEEPTVAIVGTRLCTPYGAKSAENIAFRLVSRGLTVVTGLAKGVDSAAARGAIRAGGPIIGVVGSGLDIVYPPGNESLFEDVVSNGAIISEYPPGSAARPVHFPARNRIISGISLGVLVIEAPKKSGALITAARALEEGRDVFALPGNIDAKNNEGSNLLLREGAIPILSAEDIIGEYADMFPQKIMRSGAGEKSPGGSERADLPSVPTKDKRVDKPDQGAGYPDKKEIDKNHEVEYIDLNKIPDQLSGDERLVAEVIGSGQKHVDEIIGESGLPSPQALATLTMLEIKGYVYRDGTKYKLQQPPT